MSKRIQLSRAKGWRKPAGVVVVSRPSKWGNPFLVRRESLGGPCWSVSIEGEGFKRYFETEREARQLAVGLYKQHTGPGAHYELDLVEVRAVLGGRDLACWCPLVDADGNRVPCHADVLIKMSNPTGRQLTWTTIESPVIRLLRGSST